MRFFEEYSYEEIAAKLSLPLGTVKTQIHRAREQMCRAHRPGRRAMNDSRFTIHNSQLELIIKYFPDLTGRQKEQFAALYDLYADWNAKINVVSRKDFDQLYLRHVLHSLAIAKVCTFGDGARILDVGCGGGFPSVPLAILFPEACFTAADSIRKKITVVEGVAAGLGLTNLTPRCVRVETRRSDSTTSFRAP